MNTNAVDGRVDAYYFATQTGAAPDISAPYRVELSAGSVGDFLQPSGASSGKRGRRSISDVILNMTPYGTFRELFKGSPAVCVIFPNICAAAGTDTTSSGKRQGVTANGEPIDLNQRAGMHGGEYIKLSADPILYERVMGALNKGIETVEQACGQIDRPWDADTEMYMKQLFGENADHDEIRAKVKPRLKSTLDAMKKHRDNGGRDIYLELTQGVDHVAYAPQDSVGYTGHLVLSAGSLGEIDDKSLMKTLIHENAHLGSNLTDHFYLDYDEKLGFVLRPDENGVVPPFNADDAVNNPDSLAYAAQVLARNHAAGNHNAYKPEFRR